MMTLQKMEHIKKQLRNGVPAGELKATLMAEGYSKEDIDKFFAVKKSDMRSWYLVSSIILLLIGFRIFYYHGGILVLIFSGIMFVQYCLACKKNRNV